MKRLPIFLIFLVISLPSIIAQPAGVDPFYDAVPYSVKKFNRAFLTNQDAATIKSFFENQPGFKPERILKIDQGYHHGYRIYYRNADNDPDLPEPWIQIFTVNTPECIVACQKNNPELLDGPFLGLETCSKKHGYPEEDVKELVRQYRHLATRYYRLIEDENAKTISEMNLVFQKYNSKFNNQSGQMLASGGEGLMMKPLSSKEYSWNLWIQCFEEINQIGYSTLIEYSEVPAIGPDL
ncbi:MAG: hypothetical protein V1775_12360 [Bacteroidota bacterium]